MPCQTDRAQPHIPLLVTEEVSRIVAGPKVITDCVASRYQGPEERIVEFSHRCGGGLISIRAAEDGVLVIELYRLDPTVEVRTSHDTPAQASSRRNSRSRRKEGRS